MPEAFSWVMYIPLIGHDHERVAIAHSALVTVFLVLLAVLVSSKFKKEPSELSNEELVPEDSVTLKNGFDIYVEKLLGMMEGVIGHDAHKYFWLIGTIFIYIFFANLMGIIPGLLPPTENINTNASVAIFVFLAYNIMGLKTHGVGYLKHFMGPVWWLAPLMIVIEVVSHLVRPVTLAIRLFGNINGDHMVLGIFAQVLPEYITPVMGLLVPMIFLFLGIVVSFLQAFVFSLLSTVYISMAIAHDH